MVQRGTELVDACKALLDEGKDDEALAKARAEVGSPDTDLAAHAHNWLGWYATYRKPDFDLAYEHCKKAVTLAPKWGTALLNLAYAEDKLGRKDEAYAHYQACLFQDPYNRAFAELRAIELFLELAATPLGARVVELPSDPKFPNWVLVAPSGPHVMLLCKHINVFSVHTAGGAALPDDPVAAAKMVRASSWSDEVTATEAALALSVAIRERFSHETTIKIVVSGSEVTELHVRSEALYCYFAPGKVGAKRIELDAFLEPRLEDVRTQLEASARAPELGRRMQKVKDELLAVLAARVPAPDGGGYRVLEGGIETTRTFTVYWGPQYSHEVAKLALWQGRVTLRIGRDEIALDDIDVEKAADRIADRLTLLTADRLVPGASYRVLKRFAGRKPGETVTYDHLDPRDNHWVVHLFTAEDGTTLEVDQNDETMAALEEYLALA